MAILPPNISADDFAAALGEFAEAVGAEWVLTSDEDLVPYGDHYSPVPLEDGMKALELAYRILEQVESNVGHGG